MTPDVLPWDSNAAEYASCGHARLRHGTSRASGPHREVIAGARKAGLTRVRVDGVVVSLDDDIRLDKRKKHTIDAVVDRLIAKPGLRQRLNDSIELALRHGQGVVIIAPEGQPERVVSEHRACPHCGISFPEPTPPIFIV